MKIPSFFRFTISLVLLFCLTTPIVALAGGGDKEGKLHFKNGMKFEDAEQWDKAVEEFAMAIVNTPKNAEYRLHYQRALFNASQMSMKSGNALVEQKDYKGAYNAFRKAYAYDQTNELAKAEMERMLRLIDNLNNPDKDKKDDTTDTSKNPSLKLVQTSYQKRATVDDTVPQKLEKLRDIPFPSGVDLQYLIRELAKDLDLNVLFDEESFRSGTERKVKIELKNVTAAKALDYLFLQTGLFFQRIGPRTIIVATQNRRQNFQQLVLRTYYLSNADPADVAKVVQTAIPPQPGRTPTGVLTDKSTNSITVRDTQENIQLIGRLIKSLDKDRSEVVMDVNIYEVSKTDLLKFGNQIGGESALTNLGGTTPGVVGLGGNELFGQITKAFTAFGVGINLPSAQLQAFQSKGNTKLLASTQVHAFNNEESTARIGQRVPVQTASVFAGGVGNQNGGRNDVFGGTGVPVIQYEQVGLTLKFTPIVFPNQDVQVKMEIESKDVAGASSLTPTFTERSIKGTARIQNNRTLLLASVAQGTQSEARQGLPILGLIPILGRLFSAPSRDNRQVDIVIAVTPRVLRAPIILEEDEVERPTGSLATPTSGSLEAMIVEEEREEQLASARRLTNLATVQLPDQKADSPSYVQAKTQVETAPVATNTVDKATPPKVEMPQNLKPIDTTNRTIDLTKTSDTSVKNNSGSTVPQAELKFFLPEINVMKAGEKAKVQILIESDASFNSAVLALGFDPKKIAVRKISYGEVFGKTMTEQEVKPYYNANGKTYANLSTETLTKIEGNDVLAYIEIEALADGKPEISFIPNMFTLVNNESGQSFALSFGK